MNVPTRFTPSRIPPTRRHEERPRPIVSTINSQPAETASLPAIYARTLSRYRWLLLSFAVFGASTGWLLTLPKPAIYRARTSLDIQALNENFMNLGAVDPTDKITSNSGETFLQTEIKLLQSETLLERVETKLKASGPEEVHESNLLTPFLVRLHLARPKIVSRDAMLAELVHHVTAKPIGMTRLVEISCDSYDRKLAAQFCNTLADEFVNQDLEVRWESAQKTGEWLGRQLTEVRTKLQDSEQRLQDYAQSNSLLVDDDKQSVSQDGLRLIQNSLAQAQAERVAREAQYRVGTSASPDSLPAVLDDEPSKQYQIKLAELRRQYAELSTSFTPDSAKVQKIDAQIKALEASAEQERRNMIGRLHNEFVAAADREKHLLDAYNLQEKLVSGQIAKTAQLNMLKREAESGRQLYTALLQRVKEAGFASAMKSSPIRVVDRATPPQMAIGPRRTLSCGVGFLLGGICGIAFAFFRERTDRHLRRPGDVARALSVREFGVIPSASAGTLGGERKSWYLNLRRSGHNEEALAAAGAGPVALEMVTWTRKRSLMAEAYRSTMSSILFSRFPNQRHSILVSSPTMGEGKTTLVSNLGIAMAETGRRVILVDGDLRRPRLDSIFDTGNNCGLKDVLRGDHNAATCPLGLLAVPTIVPNLFILPCGSGPEDPSELLHSKNLPALLRRLEQEFDVVLIDSPPLLHLADARTIAQLTRGIMLVLRAGVATRDTASSALALLDGDETPLLGIILNDFDPNREALYGYYRDYYQYSGRATA